MTLVEVKSRSRLSGLLTAIAALLVTGAAFAAVIYMTLEDFRVPGTQVGDVQATTYFSSDNCRNCHGDFDANVEPFANWAGSLMANAGRDPLFFAQLTNANQDVDRVGTYCLRCHVPMSIPTGHANRPDGGALDPQDEDGVTCHLCHSLVDPIYEPGVSPPKDHAILANLARVPEQYGNAMFVLDPDGTRRGPLRTGISPHETIYSPFHRSGNLCGTCHDVGNVAISRLSDGSYQYNTIGEPAPDPDPMAQFPLERTFTEWKLSAFANEGVDSGGRFGGQAPGLIRTCQDCHMPPTKGRACFFGPEHDDLRLHEFAGAAAPVLDLIGEYRRGDPAIDEQAIGRGKRKAISMLERAASLTLAQSGGDLRVRVTNESGHKLPTGHIEGRRVWIDVRCFDATGVLLREYGHYDGESAELDEPSTRVYEMHVGLSPRAAGLTGLPAGQTTHMSLADTIVKDNRIPPRGFSNASYSAGGAPVVGAAYADGQHWDDAHYALPPGAVRVTVTLYYQCTPRHYIEALRTGNVTDHWGETLYDLWTRTGKGAPIAMASKEEGLSPFLFGDIDGDCHVNRVDERALLAAFGSNWTEARFDPRADLDGDHAIDWRDWWLLETRMGSVCP